MPQLESSRSSNLGKSATVVIHFLLSRIPFHVLVPTILNRHRQPPRFREPKARGGVLIGITHQLLPSRITDETKRNYAMAMNPVVS